MILKKLRSIKVPYLIIIDSLIHWLKGKYVLYDCMKGNSVIEKFNNKKKF